MRRFKINRALLARWRGAGLPACAGPRSRESAKRGVRPVPSRQTVLFLLPLFLAAALAWAQTASEKPSADVRRVGAHLKCMCGCPDTLASCNMLDCQYSKPGKQQIAKMQALGMSDQQIIDSFVQQYGAGIYLAPPNILGMLVPYLAAAFGLVLIWAFIKRYRKPAALAELGPMEIDDPALAKYKDQIEKDLANLE